MRSAADFVDGFRRFWAAPSLDGLPALLAPDVKLVQPLAPVMRGLDEVRRNFGAIFAWLPDIRGEVDRWSGEGNVVCIEYTFDELLAEHDYECPLALDGVPCHGGFLDGRYVSPRTLWRAPAIEAWQTRLPAGELAAVLDPITARVPPHFPGVEQTKLLVRHGVTVPLVRILSIIALVEGFGGDVLRLVTLPPLGERVLDPIDGPALAHLGALFVVHARDEAGHRRMWELARDIALHRPPVPNDLAPSLTPGGAPRLLSEIPFDMEALILRLMGILVIEVFAIEAFRWACEVLGDRTLFRRHDEARTLIED